LPAGPAAAGPNIVFVLTDDLSSDLIRYLPRVRGMQQTGTSFTNNFVVSSLCCPSRAATFTGEFPHNNGVLTNGGPHGGYRTYQRNGNEGDSFALALQRAGYRTGFLGKYLNRYFVDDPPAAGWDEWQATSNAYGEYDYRLRNNAKIERHGRKPSDYMTDLLADRAASFIDTSAAAQQPFMLMVSTFAPHAPATPAPRHVGRWRGLKRPQPVAYNRLPTDPPQWLSTLPKLTPADGRRFDRVHRKRALAAYAVDELVGRLQEQLEANGIADDTYVVFSSDNGYHLGEYRLREGKQTPYDMDVRVPLVVTGPDVPAGRRVAAFTSNIDLAPTFEEIAGAATGDNVDGASLLPLLHGRTPKNWRRAVLIEHVNADGADPADPDYQAKPAGDPPTYQAVRTANALYIQYVTGEREYYDLTKDPHRLHNVAKTAPAGRLAALQQKLNALRSCRGKGCRQAAR
jgi:arylsulfatase A-like enzyme